MTRHAEASAETQAASLIEETTAGHVDDEPIAGNQRVFVGSRHVVVAALCIAYTTFHLVVMNLYPLETWTYRLSHVGGGLILGYLIFGSRMVSDEAVRSYGTLDLRLLAPAAAGVLYSAALMPVLWTTAPAPPTWRCRASGCRWPSARRWQLSTAECGRTRGCTGLHPGTCCWPSPRRCPSST